jgi:hemolysin D
MKEALKQHWDVAKAAYQQEKENSIAALPIHQADFLPAALEILEKPASPAGRFTIKLIITFFTIAVLWACFGKLDVVAVSQGKVVPKGQIKIIQTFETGVILGISVENGQSVKKGDVLIELDPTRSGADLTRLQQDLQLSQLNFARQQWLLNKLQNKKNNISKQLNKSTTGLDLSSELLEQHKLLAETEWAEFTARQSTAQYQIHERQQQKQVTHSQLDKLVETLPILKDQLEGIEELLVDNLVPRFEYLNYKERYIERQKDVIIQQDTLKQIQASISALEKQKEQQKQEFLKSVATQVAEASNNARAIQQELKKASQSSRQQKILSPVDGVVQQLAVHTLGGVVQSGDALMAIVPADRILQVEAKVLNKDIGFVKEGQTVEVKLEAFPFTKYGVIDGVVLSIDHDAVQDEDYGLVYPARISMNKQIITINGKEIPISPGMSLSAEIKTGQRRIIEFVMAPIFRYQDEALRER